jgi:hypothetical protein
VEEVVFEIEGITVTWRYRHEHAGKVEKKEDQEESVYVFF